MNWQSGWIKGVGAIEVDPEGHRWWRGYIRINKWSPEFWRLVWNEVDVSPAIFKPFIVAWFVAKFETYPFNSKERRL